MNRLELTDLSKQYKDGHKALDSVSLTIGNGMFGLLGPNGAGKSTLMKTIAGLQKPDHGTVFFNGENAVESPFIIKKQLGFLPQDFGVYKGISAYDLMMHIAVLKGIVHKDVRRKQVIALLEKTNLCQYKNKAVSDFSGGMRQRFGVAQALLGNPKIVLLDEPTAGLDPEERNRFNNLLSELGEDIIILLSTHLVEDVKNLCENMAVMQGGKIAATGRSADFVSSMEGQVWQKMIDKKERMDYENKYRVISSQLFAGKLKLRILSVADPLNGFELVNPVLEDIYFTILNRKN